MLSRKVVTSFVAAVAYSSFSLSVLVVPAIRADTQGPLNLRRLQALAFYGEAPHTIALTLLPVAIVCFYFALNTESTRWKILAGVLTAAIALTSAFGIVALGIALLCFAVSFRSRPWWKGPSLIVVIAVLSYLWITPWLSPTMIRAIRVNSPTVDGYYRYTAASWAALLLAVAGYLLLWFVLHRTRISGHLQFFALFAYVPTIIVLIWYAWGTPIIAQPRRYYLQMDMTLLAAIVFFAAAALDRLPRGLRRGAAVVIALALVGQAIHSVYYGWRYVRSTDPTRLVEYKISKWMDGHRPGKRAFISGSSSFWYNVFTDNPQFHGAHDPSVENSFIRIPVFTIYSGMNAGERDAEISILWLKAFGARAISVSGPRGLETFKPFANPRKFEGVLPVLWRDGDDVIYEVPSRSTSLAHVIPGTAVVTRTPVHGLDVEPVKPFVAALDDAGYPPAAFQWQGLNQASIRANVGAGQVIAVQITYDPGWRAVDSRGRRQPVRADGLGMMVIDPLCNGPCEISLWFTGGSETLVTRILSVTAMLVAIAYAWLGARARSSRHRKQLVR